MGMDECEDNSFISSHLTVITTPQVCPLPNNKKNKQPGRNSIKRSVTPVPYAQSPAMHTVCEEEK